MVDIIFIALHIHHFFPPSVTLVRMMKRCTYATGEL
jgi:hypothetical protein